MTLGADIANNRPITAEIAIVDVLCLSIQISIYEDITSAFELVARPGLINQERQVVNPVVLTDAAWINHMGQIVFGVSDDEICVCH